MATLVFRQNISNVAAMTWKGAAANHAMRSSPFRGMVKAILIRGL
jgi:hypothetical protein